MLWIGEVMIGLEKIDPLTYEAGSNFRSIDNEITLKLGIEKLINWKVKPLGRSAKVF